MAEVCSCAPRASPATSCRAAGRASSSCGWTIASSSPSRQRFAWGSNPPRRRAPLSDLAREIRHQQADVAAERYVITSQNVLAGPQAHFGEPPIRRVGTTTITCARRWHRRRPHHEGARGTGGLAVDVDAGLRAPRRSHADGRLRADARGRDGSIREEMVAGVRLTTAQARAFRGRAREVAPASLT